MRRTRRQRCPGTGNGSGLQLQCPPHDARHRSWQQGPGCRNNRVTYRNSCNPLAQLPVHVKNHDLEIGPEYSALPYLDCVRALEVGTQRASGRRRRMHVSELWNRRLPQAATLSVETLSASGRAYRALGVGLLLSGVPGRAYRPRVIPAPLALRRLSVCLVRLTGIPNHSAKA